MTHLILALIFLYCLGALALEAWKALNAWGAKQREALRLAALQDAYAQGYTDAAKTPARRITPDRFTDPYIERVRNQYEAITGPEVAAHIPREDQ